MVITITTNAVKTSPCLGKDIFDGIINIFTKSRSNTVMICVRSDTNFLILRTFVNVSTSGTGLSSVAGEDFIKW